MDEPKTTSGMAPARRQQFEGDIAKIRVRTGTSASETRFVTLGAALMVTGSVVALVAAIVSKTMSDSRDLLTMVIVGVFGLTLVVSGAVVFLRYSLGRFLRFWLLRLIYEQQDAADDTQA